MQLGVEFAASIDVSEHIRIADVSKIVATVGEESKWYKSKCSTAKMP